MQVTVQLPDEVVQQLGLDADIPRRVVEAVALEGYRAGAGTYPYSQLRLSDAGETG